MAGSRCVCCTGSGATAGRFGRHVVAAWRGIRGMSYVACSSREQERGSGGSRGGGGGGR